METVNAIAKARFASSQPQRVHLHKDSLLQSDLICMEPGQEFDAASGRWSYYVVKGQARVRTAAGQADLAPGAVVDFAPDEKHTITNIGEQRLICFAVGCET